MPIIDKDKFIEIIYFFVFERRLILLNTKGKINYSKRFMSFLILKAVFTMSIVEDFHDD